MHVIVDASVARSGADSSSSDVAIRSMALARAIAHRDCATGALMTPALQDEWRVHASRAMSAWLARMESLGRVRRERDRNVRDLRGAVEQVVDAGVRSALVKDLHLSEAAILHRVPVASLDERQRRYLSTLASDYPGVRRIQWFNPATDDVTTWVAWLSNGCTDAECFSLASI